jgi:hypothetical protein
MTTSIKLNFSLPKDSYLVRELGDMFYVDGINGDFSHDFWEQIKFMPSAGYESYHPSILFSTRGEAIAQSELAKIDFAIRKIKEMRSSKSINREQYLNAISELTARRELFGDTE